MESQTLSVDALTALMDQHRSREVPSLLITWAADEPQRVGEVLILRPARPGGTLLLGRGEARPDDMFPRLEPVRQRPGSTAATGPLRSRHISRDQLHIQVQPDGAVRVRCTGRCPMLVGGVEKSQVELLPGDLLELKNSLILLCTLRPLELPAWPGPATLPSLNFGESDPFGIVGESPQAWDLRERLSFIARRGDHVLITGESGTGKELAARAIHLQSARGARALISRSAATLPESLIDAELFGNAKDYPNAGMRERLGLIGEAHGSTLFLDEFGELPQEMQSHLLRVVDQGEYQRLGESRMRVSDFRLIAATNRPESHLKHDMLARLRLRIHLPDLNVRREDIPLIVRHLLRRIASQDPEVATRFFTGEKVEGEPRITPALLQALITYRYETHVRQLENLLWRAMATSRGGWIDLTPDARASLEEGVRELPRDESSAEGTGVDPLSIPPDVIQECLDRHQGLQEKVWRELGLQNRHVLARLIKKYNLNIRRPKGFAPLTSRGDESS